MSPARRARSRTRTEAPLVRAVPGDEISIGRDRGWFSGGTKTPGAW